MRINVIGSSGSGKSTFARRLADALGLPCIEMDQVFWRPDWREPSDEEFFADLRRAIAGSSWVLDGNYSRTVPIKWERVQTVIWLDYSFPLTLFRSVTRAIRRAWTREELWPGTGNRESFAQSFLSRKSIIWWSVSNFGKVRTKYERAMTAPEYAHIRFVRLRTPDEARNFLETCRASASFPLLHLPGDGRTS